MLCTVAPAKVNWTLEVLGRRADGYHEVCTVMQTIDLCDELVFTIGDSLALAVEGPHVALEDNLVLRAAKALADHAGIPARAAILLRKNIPVGSGLGGGSSDAAATLRVLNELWGLQWERDRLAEISAGIGSDVAFFLRGGTGLATGRGERVAPLPDAPPVWLVVLVPGTVVPGKTRRMYGALAAGDFTDGARTRSLAERLRRGNTLAADDLWNAFDRAARAIFGSLEAERRALEQVSGTPAQLAGAGPALYAVSAGRDQAERIAAGLREVGRIFVARTLPARSATRIERA